MDDIVLPALSATKPNPVRLRAVPIERTPEGVVESGVLRSPPRALTSLIGRDADADAACALLVDGWVRLLTLTGPGGVGKTRLALRIAEDAGAAFPDGVAFVPLAAITDPDLVLPTIVRELELRGTCSFTPLDLVVEFLRRRRFLLVLDNVEQVRPAATQLAALLAACRDLAILVTSRALLHIAGEQRFPVTPLPLPESEAGEMARWRDGTLVSQIIARSPAVQLFVARAQAVDPHFALDATNAAAIAAICRRLDGLPLAIELAAARIQMLSPCELQVHFEYALPYLTDGPADAPDRQRTMRQAIAWSYDLLSPAEQTLFRYLAVFVGGFTLEAAEHVGMSLRSERETARRGRRPSGPSGDGEIGSGDITRRLSPLFPCGAASRSVFDLTSALVDHSLLRRIARDDGEPRFAMLETVREYGLERLTASGEEATAHDAHATYFLALAEQAEPELQDATWVAWVDRLVRELPNLRSALGYWRDRGDGEGAIRLAGALGLFWTLPAYVREGRSWLEMVIALPGADRAPESLAKALNAIGVVANWQSDVTGAQKALNRALVIRQQVKDELGIAEVLGNLGNAALDAGDFDRAETLLAQSLPLYQSNGKTFWFGEALLQLGHTVRARGEYDRSAEYHEAAVAVLRELPDRNKLGEALVSLGWAELVRGDLARSRVAYREGLAVAQAGNDRMRLGRSVCGAAALAGAGGDPVRAAQLFAAAAAQRDEEQIRLKPTIQAEHDRFVAKVRDTLGEAAFAALWRDAYALDLEEAVEVATAMLADPVESLSSAPAAAEVMAIELPALADPHGPLRLALELGVTTREVEVLHLVAAGQADKEIAAALGISRHTASKHVAALRAKLAAPSRTGAVAVAREAGLL